MEDNHNFVPTCPFLAQRCYLFVSPRYRRHDFCIIGRNFRQLENPGEPAGSDRPNFLTINYRNFGSAGFWQCSSSVYHYPPADQRHLMGLTTVLNREKGIRNEPAWTNIDSFILMHRKWKFIEIKIIQLGLFWLDQNCGFSYSKIDCF